MHVASHNKFISALALGIFAASTISAPQATQNGFNILKNMTLDPDGFVHVADDGVARSYAANNTVIDYVALSNSQIQQMISQLPVSYQEHLEHLRQVFEGVDGYDVTDKSQLLEPPPWLQPFEIEPATPPQPRDEAHEVASALENRQINYYVGQPCTTTTAYQFLGCAFYGDFGRVYAKVCYP